jgi:tetratricopeptide (TPR) repeat protein
MAVIRLAVALRELDRIDDALAAHADAVARLKALLGEQKGDNNYQHFYGRALVEQARTLTRLPDRRPQAEGDLGEAIRLWDDLQARFPTYPMYREWQALAYSARGQARAAQGRPGPAAEDFERARALWGRLVRESPELPGYRGHLGRTYADLGRLARSHGDAARAADWLAKAEESLRAAQAGAPENALDRHSLEEVRAELKQLPAGTPAGR